jgi:vacuolar-type H+-ATPase subunit E/Vma4
MAQIKDEIWLRHQLKEVERLQKGIIVQQSRADESLDKLQKESAVLLKKIGEVDSIVGGFVSPELEQGLIELALRAKSIDEKVSDIPPCSED